MKKKVAILGSTGSIGRTSLAILKKNLKNFEITLLHANSNYKLIKEQIRVFKPKYFIALATSSTLRSVTRDKPLFYC